MTILSGKDLNKEYVNRDRSVRPLQHVDFELNQGEILGIVGESGSGKSTLLKVISGIEKPDSGKLYHMDDESSRELVERILKEDSFEIDSSAVLPGKCGGCRGDS